MAGSQEGKNGSQHIGIRQGVVLQSNEVTRRERLSSPPESPDKITQENMEENWETELLHVCPQCNMFLQCLIREMLFLKNNKTNNKKIL